MSRVVNVLVRLRGSDASHTQAKTLLRTELGSKGSPVGNRGSFDVSLRLERPNGQLSLEIFCELPSSTASRILFSRVDESVLDGYLSPCCACFRRSSFLSLASDPLSSCSWLSPCVPAIVSISEQIGCAYPLVVAPSRALGSPRLPWHAPGC